MHWGITILYTETQIFRASNAGHMSNLLFLHQLTRYNVWIVSKCCMSISQNNIFKNNRQLLGCKMKEIQVVSKNFRGTKTNCQGEKMTEFLRVNGSHSPLLSLPLCTLLPVLRLFLIRHLEAYTTATLGFYLNTLAALKWLEGILTTTGSRLRSPSSSNTTTLKPEGWTCWTLGVHKPPTHIQGNPLTPPDHLSIMLVPAYKPHWST